MLEHALIAHCAPTLARMKVGSLFNLAEAEPELLARELERLRAELGPKGLTLELLCDAPRRTLIYLYRADELARTLEQADVRAFLKARGYDDCSPRAVIDAMRVRLTASPAFPHEIGVLLGYPLEDVIAFIENDGRNCACCGCWKAYANACDAQRMFARYHKCKEVYMRLFAAGRTLAQLTVATQPA